MGKKSHVAWLQDECYQQMTETNIYKITIQPLENYKRNQTEYYLPDLWTKIIIDVYQNII